MESIIADNTRLENLSSIFYFAQYKLIIEIDGDSHAAQIDYDRIRTSWLENEGYRILRYTNRDVMDHPVAVLEDILDHCKKA